MLYGDGAVGGVINIVTKTGVALPPSLKLGGQLGSYGYSNGNISMSGSNGPWSASAFGNAISSDGYRENNNLMQRGAVGDLRYTGDMGSAYLNLSGDNQKLGLPGARLVSPPFVNELLTYRRGATTPFDYGAKSGANATGGFTRIITPGTEVIVDGGIRTKNQESAFFSNFGSDFDAALDTRLTTYSVTPRIVSAHNLFEVAPSNLIAGIDYYNSDYGSNRSLHVGDSPNHRYDIQQKTLGAYFQETVRYMPGSNVAFGGRTQWNNVKARDRLDMLAPGGFFAAPEGTPLDWSENQWAAHIGIDHRFNDVFGVFGRVARSFRLPNVDERVGQGPFGVPTNFDLRTQTSHDAEVGFRVRWRSFHWQTSAYVMDLKDEIFFSPATFTNVNLDPTRRRGSETIAGFNITDAVVIKGGYAYTSAQFRDGPFRGNDVPLVAKHTGMAGVSWNIIDTRLTFDGIARFVGSARMDNDLRNLQPFIPAHTVVDVRVGGKIDRISWSVAVQNVFNQLYFDYAIASAFTLGTYNAYPLQGRTVLGKLALEFN